MNLASISLAFTLICMGICQGTVENLIGKLVEIPVRETDINLAARESDGNGVTDDDGSETYLRILSKLEDIEAVSGDKVQFRCRVEANPSQNLTYTWYHGNTVLEDSFSRRRSIKTRGTSSRLTFSEVYTADSGDYRCEVSNGILRVSSDAHLDVRFKVPPPAAADEDDSMKLPPSKCELYTGQTCQQYLGGRTVFIDGFSNQKQTEQQIAMAANILKKPGSISTSCQVFALPALCFYMFPVCEDGNADSRAEDRSKQLCREDCEVLKYDVCRDDFANPTDTSMKAIATTANCSFLPKATSLSNCLQVDNLPRSVKPDHRCYNDTGADYLGMQFKTSAGNICKTWPLLMVTKYKELAGGHNYCRNPGEEEDFPWCFIDEKRRVRQTCDIAKCSTKDTGSSLLTILIPSVAIPLLIALIALVFCICRRKKTPQSSDSKVVNERSNPSNPNYELTPFLATKFIVPELNPNSIVYKEDLGEGQYGKVYKGQILQNPSFMSNFPVAVKTFNASDSARIAEFQREIEVFSALQHPNVACLKAFVCKPAMRCLVFEYTNSIDLHEMLSMHSPNSDFSVKLGSNSSQTSATLEHGDFINMAIQISSGMDFLSGNNFVHRDVAARNVLVCQNTTLKICNLGVVRDCYLASYYRSPQMGEMLPLRWMSPEAIQFSQFSEKSAVWSFGVLLWEMFSFGMQPYCGFSNQEVLEMIPTQRLLGCPDQCPARVYSLMRECWSHNANTRPSFKEILSKLSTWQGANSTSMTSQLARGIHRQLNGLMADGYNGQYAMSDTAPSFSTASVESPPRYNVAQNLHDGRMNSGSESFAPPSYPNSSHLSQQMGYQRNQHELIVDMPPANHLQQQIQPNYYQKPVGYDVHSGASNSECDIKTPGYYTQSQFNKPRIPRHSSVSSRSTTSAGSAREQRQQELIQNKLRNTDNVFISRQNTGDEFVNMQHQNQGENTQVPSATVQPYTANFNQQPNQPKPHAKPEKDVNAGHDGDVSSSSSDHTISCDSGLPAEDNFSHLTSSNVRYPLLGPKPYTNPSSPNKALS